MTNYYIFQGVAYVSQRYFLHAIKKARKAAGEQQKGLGEAIGIAQTQISAIENGKQGTSFEKLAEICKHYNLSADYLLGLINDPRPLE